MGEGECNLFGSVQCTVYSVVMNVEQGNSMGQGVSLQWGEVAGYIFIQILISV